MTIIELLAADGFFSKKVANTGGGEYAGPCPFCGGEDRFRCWPEMGEGGRWWCRQCERSGDGIEYLKIFRKLGLKEAAQIVGKQLSNQPLLSSVGEEPRTAGPQP